MAVLATSSSASTSDDPLNSNNPAVLLDWGQRHFHGVRATQNIDRAVQFYCAAARLGNAEAQYRLGDIYARTLLGKRDEVLAAAWLLKAAAGQYSAAKTRLKDWDLSTTSFPADPDCVTREHMVARTLPSARPTKPAKAPKPKPTAAPIPRLALDTPDRREIERLVRTLAPRHRLNPDVVLAVIQVESNFNPKAQSHKQAQGLMQLIPDTARRFGVADPWDARQNIDGGMAYLRWLLDHFNGDLRLALAGYNAGEQAVRRHGGVPPYKETQGYVRKIARVLGVSEEGLAAVQTTHAPIDAASASQSETDWARRFFTPG
ncbi:transglycosylase SLT domain-containing protein [Allochromatium humboldtianum]|uniref:Transglycosylase SLT domain-containing protein n=1 Tax=Allochromatium humboldtianum TaxID=504901 RepID=A0A850R3W6_9GAMM|nr:lytic transglycosylase domain-containing protein [Allochromatium humboldtianum]NVZ08344.1 transglycosylase SLT domain-containing protein [Allochromatium humboldtianum]